MASQSIVGKKRSRETPRVPSTAPKGSDRSISGLRNICRQISTSSTSSTSSVAPKQKRNKLTGGASPSLSVESLGTEPSQHDRNLAQLETRSEAAQEDVEEPKAPSDSYSENPAEDATTSDEESSEESSKISESEAVQEREPAQNAEETGNVCEGARSNEEQDVRASEDTDSEAGKKRQISLRDTRVLLGTAIATLQSVTNRAHLVNETPESTRKAIEAHSEWSGATHSRYDTLEGKYNQGPLEVDDVEKLVSIFKADLALAEKIRMAVNDEKEAAASVWDFMKEIPGL
ncbi:hypothetical protein M407DRAFT_32211 [Tulasnella calospora MUT 4182]|uniref:Uncharacterized protein n=1 Tax=Tulasnella calospora MUT 4182 TaxID=1051891 RepID=A0A0C3Q4D2_9AGAM|nr:hypothetical protein M407DRAFT_32211 [Tulasnella calospora MUT 4182]